MSALDVEWARFVDALILTAWQRRSLNDIASICRPHRAGVAEDDSGAPGLQVVWDQGPRHLSVTLYASEHLEMLTLHRETGAYELFDCITAVDDRVRDQIAVFRRDTAEDRVP